MPQGPPPPRFGVSCFCLVLLLLGLLSEVLQEPPRRQPPPPEREPQPQEAPQPHPPSEPPHQKTSRVEPRRTPGLPGPTKVTLLDHARERATRGAVTLVVAGHAHLELLLNWLVTYERHSSNWVLGCLDAPLAAFLEARHIPCVLVPHQGGPLVPGLRLREKARSAAA